ncbi:hypothetical protein AGRO_3109 [Agrobacterium sp. ATCC 31749]|nr:hypothetical protein AGRO_3109 [Agrobacterium sp. ATCC 31749]
MIFYKEEKMLIDVNDLGSGYKNVSSRFRVNIAEKTVLSFTKRLGERTHKALIETGACMPMYVVPAECWIEGKYFQLGIAIPTSDPEGSFRGTYYLFGASHEQFGADEELEDRRSVAQFCVVTELALVRPASARRQQREENVYYISDGDYRAMKTFLN